jgi:TorA maturation chaperone TorD
MTEWADKARTRQGLYRFIGAALRHPETKQLALLSSSYPLLDDRGLDSFAFSREWRRLGRALTSGFSLEELEVEYVRLFGVGMTGTPAMPTESEYRVQARDGESAVFISSLRGEYRSMGLATVGDVEAPDHISTELEVMSYLCGVEAAAWDSGQDSLAMDTLGAEARFLKGHLGVWVPLFADRVRAANPNPFFSCVVDLTHAIVANETDYVHLIVGRGVTA